MTRLDTSTPTSLSPFLVSVTAGADSGLLSRLTTILARLDILPLQIHARLLNDEGEPHHRTDDMAQLEVDLYLHSQSGERRDRLVSLLRSVVGVERVVASS